MARPEKIRLGDLLIQQGLLTEEQLKLALDEQKRSGRKLGRIIVDSGYVTEDGIAKALARQLQADFVDLKSFDPDAKLTKLLPESNARRFRALVLAEKEGKLVVGFADPTDLQVFDEVARLLRREIDLAVVSESQLLAAIDRLYHRTEEIRGLAKELTADLSDGVGELGDILGLSEGQEDAPVVKLLQSVFDEALPCRALSMRKRMPGSPRPMPSWGRCVPPQRWLARVASWTCRCFPAVQPPPTAMSPPR
jgi:MSHA biogenesis protein MshE